MSTPINTRGQLIPYQPAFDPSAPKLPGLSPSALQRELDTIATQIEGLGSTRVSASSGFEATDISTALSRFRVGNTSLSPGQSVDLNVEVAEAYEQAGLFLSFAGTNIDFTAGSTFNLDIEGNLGARELSFTSGTTLADIAASINTFSSVTGVTANVSGTGVTLNSNSYGNNEFISVSAGGDATLSGTGIGVFGLRANTSSTANTADQTTYANAVIFPVTDSGQDLAALVNGKPAQTDGAFITYTGQFLTAQFELKLGTLEAGETANASNAGSFLAARILYAEPAGPVSRTPPGIDLNG